jgi:hypothetical protein
MRALSGAFNVASTMISESDEYLCQEHVAWARAHDWGRTAVLDGDKIVLDTGESFSTFEELRAWAGY